MSKISLQTAIDKLGIQLARWTAENEALRESLEIHSKLNTAFVELCEANDIDWKESLGLEEVPSEQSEDEDILTQVDAT